MVVKKGCVDAPLSLVRQTGWVSERPDARPGTGARCAGSMSVTESGVRPKP